VVVVRDLPVSVFFFSLLGALLLGALLLAACTQPQSPSNVGGDGLDRVAAAEALRSIEPSACDHEAGPTGPVHLTVVFDPEGHVADAQLDGGGESGGGRRRSGGRGADARSVALEATPRGACILERLRELHVPAFRGRPTKVARDLTLR